MSGLPVSIDTELINLANAALEGRIADPARCASILDRADRHLRDGSYVFRDGAERYMRGILDAADSESV